VTPSSKFKQDAVIGMAILVVALSLWRLHSRPRLFGKLGSWAETNIFGATTLSLIPGAGGSAAGGEETEPGTNPVAIHPDLVRTNPPITPSNPAPDSTPEVSSNSPLITGPAQTKSRATNAEVVYFAMDDGPSETDTERMARRLREEHAKGGDIQISLSWHNYNDLDLHCAEPGGEEIFYSHTNSITGGELDIDQNYKTPYLLSPVENIFWPAGSRAKKGWYEISVVHYAQHQSPDPTAFLVRVIAQGKTNFIGSRISDNGARKKMPVARLFYDPANPGAAQCQRRAPQ
jgi:hypothetical protein